MIISVVIPCRNEERHIQKCVEHIYGSDLESDVSLEVIIVDGMSDDNTLSIIKSMQAKFDTLQLVTNVQKVTPVAFNLGINAAKGDYIQIVGARQLISANYLQAAMDKLVAEPTIWCIGGAVENVYENPESILIGKAMSSSFGVGVGNFRIVKEATYTDTVGTPMYPKNVFDKIGLFDEQLVRNQDDELNYRIIKAGGKIYLDPNFSLKYFVRAKINHLKKQYYQYGYWKVYVNKKHKTITTLRQLVPLIFVLCLIFGIMLSLLFPILWFVFFGGLLVYASVALYAGQKEGGTVKEGLNIAKIFPVLHLSYGFGYLIGVFHFLVFNKNPSSKSKELSRG
jgi:glycosyltransferase involved in cell wall biosynthesis